ncbi:MAG: redoxin domain-containing protein [Bacteroidetes bacterium]|nr:redoxin domain-containing protein [Bacteroidota bacterium]
MRYNSLYLLALSIVFLTGCGKTAPASAQMSSHQLPAERAKLAAEIEDQGGEHVHMPPLPRGYSADRYYNVNPADLSPGALKGKIVLLDIWDYTCVNCIRTLPYIRSWAEKYKDKGLVIIGVHSPEFDFEKAPENLKAAIEKFKLDYPIVADNEYEIWTSLANKYWPAKYIFDGKGILRATHFGEGEYQQFEAFIQKLLIERDSNTVLPELSELVRSTDKPGAVCYRPTPETYVGFERNHLGNAEEATPNKPEKFVTPSTLQEDRLYLDGSWVVRREFAAPAGIGTSSLVINYEAKEVNLVIKPQSTGHLRVLVEQDGKPIAAADRGTDIVEDAGKTYIAVDEPRMYNIVNNSKFGRAVLRLSSDSPSFGAYAFTFTSDCKQE